MEQSHSSQWLIFKLNDANLASVLAHKAHVPAQKQFGTILETFWNAIAFPRETKAEMGLKEAGTLQKSHFFFLMWHCQSTEDHHPIGTAFNRSELYNCIS